MTPAAQVRGTAPAAWNVPAGIRPVAAIRRPALLAAVRFAPEWGPLVVCGPAGVGKTRLALEYALTHRRDYDVVWWVRAGDGTTLRADLAALGRALGIAGADGADLAAAATAVRTWLAGHDRWLLVADDAADPDDVRDVLPDTGKVVVTTRHEQWAGAAGTVRVAPPGEAEAAELLMRRTGERDPHLALELARELGCLPLAVELAGALARHPGVGLARYLDLLRLDLLGGRGRAPATDCPAAVAVTCALAFDRVQETSPAAAVLLRACSFLGPAPVPSSLLETGVDELPEPLVADATLRADALAALEDLALVSAWGGDVRVHRLVQAAVRDQLDGAGRRGWVAGALRLVAAAFDGGDDPAAWDRCAALLPHALAVSGRDGAAELEPQATSSLLGRVAAYEHARGQLAPARGLLDRAVAVAEIAYGPDDAAAGARLADLAAVLHDMGEDDDAKVCVERALVIAELAYGPDDPRVAALLDDLACILKDLGELTGARRCLERALWITEAVDGRDHPAVARALTDLGHVLRGLGEVDGALDCYRQALEIDEAAYGPGDPIVARDISNRALLLHDLGATDDARADLDRALALAETALGPEHAEVGIHLDNLAAVLHDRGELVAAKALLTRALAIARVAHGPGHESVADRLNNLGAVLGDLGELQSAYDCFDRAVPIAEAAHGPDHPVVRSIRANRAVVAHRLGGGAPTT